MKPTETLVKIFRFSKIFSCFFRVYIILALKFYFLAICSILYPDCSAIIIKSEIFKTSKARAPEIGGTRRVPIRLFDF